MSYSDLNAIIAQKDVADSAAEIHGIAVAMLCLHKNTPAHDWINEAFSETLGLLKEDKVALNHLFEQIKMSMVSNEFVFDLYLPDLDKATALTSHCTALVQWCQGFLFGMGQVQTNNQWSSAVDEILKDMIELTKLDVEIPEDNAEEASGDLVEIQQYLCAVVMLIYSELHLAVENNRVH